MGIEETPKSLFNEFSMQVTREMLEVPLKKLNFMFPYEIAIKLTL